MGIKTCKKGKDINLRDAEVKFLIEHDKKEFKYCIITLYIEETPDTNISDTRAPNELKQVSAHNCFYISDKAPIKRCAGAYSISQSH